MQSIILGVHANMESPNAASLDGHWLHTKQFWLALQSIYTWCVQLDWVSWKHMRISQHFCAG